MDTSHFLTISLIAMLATCLAHSARIGDACSRDSDCNAGSEAIISSMCGKESRCECQSDFRHINPTTCLKRDLESARKALEFVARIESQSTCKGGTGTVLQLNVDYSIWDPLTRPAIITANYLTDVLVHHNNTLDTLTEEELFRFVRNNVNSEDLVVGSAIAIEAAVYSKYPERFSPYAHKGEGMVKSHDLSMNYDYFAKDCEWYRVLRARNWAGRSMPNQEVRYNKNTTAMAGAVILQVPSAVLLDGYWTQPYYDCGGADIWMVTYSSPIFGLKDSSTYFLGVATIDIELTRLDVNQCEPDEDFSGVFDVFHGTHNCQPTTRCVPVSGKGFVRGAYECHCKAGYYFPDTSSSQKYYPGKTLEDAHDKSQALDEYRCTTCPPGCDVCDDDTPCMFEENSGLRIFLLVVGILTLIFVVVVFVFLVIFKRKSVIETGSFPLLSLMLLGGILICIEVLIKFREPAGGTCIAQGWFHHLGFFIMYVALGLKTHRISAHFHFRGADQVPHSQMGNQHETTLLSTSRQQSDIFMIITRMVPIVIIVVAYLIVWSAALPSEDTIEKTSSGLKFSYCSHSAMEFVIFGVEGVMLLFIVYLGFSVQAPGGHFPEGRHLEWAAYNALVLGIVVTLIIVFAVLPGGPEAFYGLDVVRQQIFVTVTIAIVFIPKFLAASSFGQKDFTDTNMEPRPSGLDNVQLES